MKCQDCERPARWIITQLAPYADKFLFYPVCEEHFQEIREMEGEMNLDFDLIDNLTVEEVINTANKEWAFIKKKTAWLWQENSKLTKSSVGSEVKHK